MGVTEKNVLDVNLAFCNYATQIESTVNLTTNHRVTRMIRATCELVRTRLKERVCKKVIAIYKFNSIL